MYDMAMCGNKNPKFSFSKSIKPKWFFFGWEMYNISSGFRNVQILTLTLICELTTPLKNFIARVVLFYKNVMI